MPRLTLGPTPTACPHAGLTPATWKSPPVSRLLSKRQKAKGIHSDGGNGVHLVAHEVLELHYVRRMLNPLAWAHCGGLLRIAALCTCPMKGRCAGIAVWTAGGGARAISLPTTTERERRRCAREVGTSLRAHPLSVFKLKTITPTTVPRTRGRARPAWPRAAHLALTRVSNGSQQKFRAEILMRGAHPDPRRRAPLSRAFCRADSEFTTCSRGCTRGGLGVWAFGCVRSFTRLATVHTNDRVPHSDTVPVAHPIGTSL